MEWGHDPSGCRRNPKRLRRDERGQEIQPPEPKFRTRGHPQNPHVTSADKNTGLRLVLMLLCSRGFLRCPRARPKQGGPRRLCTTGRSAHVWGSGRTARLGVALAQPIQRKRGGVRSCAGAAPGRARSSASVVLSSAVVAAAGRIRNARHGRGHRRCDPGLCEPQEGVVSGFERLSLLQHQRADHHWSRDMPSPAIC
jgi:hypothetical protein